MATNVRGRTGSGSQSKWNSDGSYDSGWGKGTSGKRSTCGTTTCGTSPQGTPAAYKSYCRTFENKINSFKTLFNQTKGTAKYQRPTPAMLNTFANWINKGAVVQTVSCAQVARWAKMANKNFTTKTATPTNCKTVLCAKFGKPTIKAVCRTKTGSFMVATSPMWKGRSFCFPK